MKYLKCSISFLILLALSLLFCNPIHAQWESLGSGIEQSPRIIFGISVVDSNTIWGAGIHPTLATSAREFTLSTDGGESWSSGIIEEADNDYSLIGIYGLDSNTAWVTMTNTGLQNRGKIFKTTDGGNIWVEQTGVFNELGHAVMGPYFFDADEGFAYGSPGTGISSIDSLRVYRTIDGGTSWLRIPAAEFPSPLAGEGIWIYSGNNFYEVVQDTIWFGTRKGRIFRSTDRGVSWEAFSVDLGTSTVISSVAFKDGLNGMAVGTNGSNKAAVTSDGGQSWTPISLPIPNSIPAGSVEYISGTENSFIVFDGFFTNTHIVYYTNDGGMTWYELDLFPHLSCVQFISSGHGFAGGEIITADEGGIYKWVGEFEDLVSSVAETLIPNSNISIFPNPSTGNITLKFNDLPFTGKVTIYDLNGSVAKEVEVKMKQTQVINHIPVGTYLVHMQSKTNIYPVKKVIIH